MNICESVLKVPLNADRLTKPHHVLVCVQTMHIERTILSLDVGCSLPGIVRSFQVQSRRTFTLSPVEVAVDMLRRKNGELQSLIRRYLDMQRRQVELSLNPLTMALKGVVDPAVMGGIVKYQEVGCDYCYYLSRGTDNKITHVCLSPLPTVTILTKF